MLQRLRKIKAKIGVVGLIRALRVATARLGGTSRDGALRKNAHARRAHHTWDRVGGVYQFRPIAWVEAQNNESLYIVDQMGIFPLWHEGYEDMAQTFYKDIVLRVGQGPDLAPDIKTPWEYSRFLWAPQLALAHSQTGDNAYKKRYIALITDWIERNPYLLGINWLCPMEVAIRAINGVISYTLIAPDLEEPLRQKIVCSLYDHMIYLERNWELADGRTSNHYLSDLVGYLYLAWFFNDASRQRWAMAQIEQEMAWQVFDEGTSYEGSTSYHRLVTELFAHADLMARECGLSFSEQFYQKLSKMREFIQWCGDIKIGDDDSGRVTIYDLLSKSTPQRKKIKQYPEFGISIIKTPTWHITLRHPSYQERQPTGHFHEDAGSFTLTYKGIPVFIDPGSYVYTPSAWWRDHFRGANVHNKLYAKNDDQISAHDDMFTLRLPQSQLYGKPIETDTKYSIETSYYLDVSRLIGAHKKVECDALTNSILISDSLAQDITSNVYANLTGAPGIKFERKEDKWMVMHRDQPLFIMQSTLDYQPYDAWVAPCYGEKIKTVGLRAVVTNQHNATYFAAVRE